jgi:hypothetical protein
LSVADWVSLLVEPRLTSTKRATAKKVIKPISAVRVI